MQIKNLTLPEIKALMKAEYPREYALIIVQYLRQQGIRVSKQQVYNFFNNFKVTKGEEIINTAAIIINKSELGKEKEVKLAA